MNIQVDAGVVIETQPALRAPRVVEVVGPAGAGKTALCEALTKASADVRLANFPDIRRLKAAPFFGWHGLRMAGSLLQAPSSHSRRLSGREFAWMCILDGWPQVLRQEWERKHQISILDQGPIYLLTELSESGPEHIRQQLANGHWQIMYEQWACILDAVVWLDAPDRTLVERIRTREKGHIVKEQPEPVMLDYIHRFRAAYGQTLAQLSAQKPDLRVLRYDTGLQTSDEIACELLAAFGLKP